MKKYIRASKDEIEKVYTKFDTPKGRYRFSGNLNRTRGYLSGQFMKLAAYDDAEYVWADVSFNGQVKFIKDGKTIDKMQLWSYAEEDYEDVNDYFADVSDAIIKDLINYNKDIEPRMVHN